MICTVTAQGKMSDCRVVEESPIGMDFGDAVLKLSPRFKVREVLPDGSSAQGGTIRLAVRWAVPER